MRRMRFFDLAANRTQRMLAACAYQSANHDRRPSPARREAGHDEEPAQNRSERANDTGRCGAKRQGETSAAFKKRPTGQSGRTRHSLQTPLYGRSLIFSE